MFPAATRPRSRALASGATAILSAAILGTFLCGCGIVDGGKSDLAMSSGCDAPGCGAGHCTTSSQCGGSTSICDPSTSTCVGCIGNSDCDAGSVCGAEKRCVPGCSATQRCVGGVCEVDSGTCVECTDDGACTGDPTHPRCDTTAHRCVGCLPQPNTCPPGQYCAVAADNSVCIPGCNTTADCTGADGGDGGSVDGGAGATVVCDQTMHECVLRCSIDRCPRGQICMITAGSQAGSCVPGCDPAHPCQSGASCCGGQCTDTTSDNQNCGGCDVACNSGWNCCNSMCSNLTNDSTNCGGCGIACAVINGTPKCVTRTCAIASCNPGFQDCNGNLADGCETNIDSNVNNCGGCGNVCLLPNHAVKCVASACAE